MLRDASLCTTYMDNKHVLMHISNQTLYKIQIRSRRKKTIAEHND